MAVLEHSQWPDTDSGLAFLAGFYGALIGIFALIVLAFGWLRGISPRVTQFLMIGATILLTFIGLRFILQGLGVIQ